MKTKRETIALRLSAPQRARLDRLAKRKDTTRTALIREAIDVHLARCEGKEVPHGRV